MKPTMKSTEYDDISGKHLDDKVVLRILPYLKPHRLLFLFTLLLVFVSAGVSLFTPKLLGLMVDRALVPHNHILLIRLCALYGVLEVVRLVCIFTQSFHLQSTGQAVMLAIRQDLFAKLTHMPMIFFDHNPVGKLVTRVTNDTVNLSELFSANFVMLLSDILLIVGVIVAMLLLHVKMGLLVLSVFPLMIYAMTYFAQHLRIAFRNSREVLARLNSFFAERMSGMPIVQLMEREAHEKRRFSKISEEYRARQFEGVYLYSLFHPTITVLSGASIVMVILFAPRFIHLGEIGLGTLISFLAYSQVLYQPVRNITDRYNVFLQAMSSAERIFTLMDMEEEANLREPVPDNSLTLSGALEFRNVHFSYYSQQSKQRLPALKEVSFSVQPGEKVAVIGHTGAGKTTITSLLFRFYDVDQGQIFLDGKEIREIPKNLLRRKIGFVQQDVFLFSGSLRENLRLLNEDASDAEIMAACQITGFNKVMQRSNFNLDSLLDERGSNLSFGERQILAFTRVCLQKPDLLILDEATSSVDRASEQLIHHAADALTRNRTSLIIAHRMETVLSADRILVLEKGRLLEEGSHSQLLSKNGVYARFAHLQTESHP